MKIYRDEIEILDFLVNDDATITTELMIERKHEFSFELSDYVSLEKGDYILHNGEKFSLSRDFIPETNKSTGGYIYNVAFYDFTKRFEDFILKHEQHGSKETDFTLTTTGDVFGGVIIQAILDEGLGTFTLGSYPEGVKEIHFEHVDIFSGINLIAQAYETEWWFDENILNFGKYEHGIPVVLEYDKEVDDITFSKSTEEVVTRLIAYGGTRNIPSDYRGGNEVIDEVGRKRLRLPEGVNYVDLFPGLPEKKIIQRVKVFDNVFPRQQNTIVEVASSVVSGGVNEQDTTIYTIRGDNTFTITDADIEPGKPLMIAFESGHLMGQEFELIIRDNNKFEIRYKQNGNYYLPNTTLKPQVGDRFFFFNFNVENVLPALITDAENELKTEAENFLANIGRDIVFDVQSRPIRFEEQEIALKVGDRVALKSPSIGEVYSRVRKCVENHHNPHDCVIQVGDAREYTIIDKLAIEAKEIIGGTSDNTAILAELTKFLRKDRPDTAQKLITFLGGLTSKEIANLEKGFKTGDYGVDMNGLATLHGLTVEETAKIFNIALLNVFSSEEFTSGLLGTGFRLNKDGDNWVLELDEIIVRKAMTVFELIIQKVRYQGGQVIHSPAGGKITNVTDEGDYWKVEHDSPDSFTTGAQVFCQTTKVGSEKQNPEGLPVIDGVSVKRYWRLVTSSGKGWFNLSKTDMEPGSAEPEIDDEIAVLGHRTDKAQQAAIMLVSVGSNSPYTAYYSGINSYSLEGKEPVRVGNLKGIIDPDFGPLDEHGLYARNAYLKGILRVLSGKNIEDIIEEARTRVGGVNLLREYDGRFDLKYWGKDGEMVDVEEIQPTTVLILSDRYDVLVDEIDGKTTAFKVIV